MNRISFLKQPISGCAVLILPNPAPAKTTSENLLCKQESLTLKREAQNPFDQYTVEVYRHEAKLGYLPRKENKVIARLIDPGIEVKTEIMKIDLESYPYRRMKIKVFYEV